MRRIWRQIVRGENCSEMLDLDEKRPFWKNGWWREHDGIMEDFGEMRDTEDEDIVVNPAEQRYQLAMLELSILKYHYTRCIFLAVAVLVIVVAVGFGLTIWL